MRDKPVLITCILISIVLAGCQFPESNTSITDADVRKGFDGLIIDFTKNAPPERVYENGIFPIVVSLKNKGAFDIGSKENTDKTGNGILVLGFEKDYVDAAKNNKAKQEFSIKGKSVFNLNGDEELITTNAQAKRIGTQSEVHTSTILATACYPYKTIFGDSVCIDTDAYGTRKGQKACEIKELMYETGQGAPVAVAKIETRMLPDADENKVKPHFIIYVENNGNGEVIDPNRGIINRACTNEPLEYKNFNTLVISASLSGQALNCKVNDDDTESATIRLRDKKDMVRCTLEKGISRNTDAYTAPLKIELNYGYTFTVSKNVIIEKVLTY